MNSATKQTYKLLIFDLDGTLIDSVPDLTTALGLLCSRFRFRPSRKRWFGRSSAKDSAAWSSERSVAAAIPMRKVRRFRCFWSTIRSSASAATFTAPICQTRLYDGVTTTLRELGNTATLAVATNKPDAGPAPCAKRWELRRTVSFCARGR